MVTIPHHPSVIPSETFWIPGCIARPFLQLGAQLGKAMVALFSGPDGGPLSNPGFRDMLHELPRFG